MSTLSAILAAILGVVFVVAGIQKLTRQKMVVANFERWGYADVVLQGVGWLEVLTGALLLVGIAVPALAVAGSMLVLTIMLGALATHQRAHDAIALWIPPAALLIAGVVLAYSMLP